MTTQKEELILIYGYLREYLKDYMINNISNIVKKYYIIKYYWYKSDWLKGLNILNNGLIVKHIGQDCYNFPITCNVIFECGINSYEIEIINFDDSYGIVIGVVGIDYIPKHSVCFIGLDLNTFGLFGDRDLWKNGENLNKTYGKRDIEIGDIVKCIVNYNDNTISYCVNGISFGIAFDNVTIPVKPGISLYNNHDCIELLNVTVNQ